MSPENSFKQVPLWQTPEMLEVKSISLNLPFISFDANQRGADRIFSRVCERQALLRETYGYEDIVDEVVRALIDSPQKPKTSSPAVSESILSERKSDHLDYLMQLNYLRYLNGIMIAGNEGFVERYGRAIPGEEEFNADADDLLTRDLAETILACASSGEFHGYFSHVLEWVYYKKFKGTYNGMDIAKTVKKIGKNMEKAEIYEPSGIIYNTRKLVNSLVTLASRGIRQPDADISRLKLTDTDDLPHDDLDENAALKDVL